jgi:hypothetical protein
MLIELVIDRIRKSANVNKAQARGTLLGSLAIAQVEPPLAEIARSGRMFHGGTQIIANGIAPVAAIPTTAATLALCNTDAAGGRSLIVDHLAVFLGSGTPAAGMTLLGAVAPVTALPAANAAQPTGYGVAPSRGMTSASKAVWATALTLTGTPVWSPILSTLQAAAANVGQGDNVAELRGSIIVPPGYVLALAILSGAGTTPLYGIGARWGEMELDLE